MKGILRDKRLSMKARGGVYEAVIMPTMLHGAETWRLREVERSQVDVFEM